MAIFREFPEFQEFSLVWEFCQWRGGIVVIGGVIFGCFRKIAVQGRWPEGRPREKSKQNERHFIAAGSIFSTRGVLKIVFVERGFALRLFATRRPRGNWTPPNPQYPKKTIKVFLGHFGLRVSTKSPHKELQGEFCHWKGRTRPPPPQTWAKQNPLFLMNTFGSSFSKTPCLVTFKCLMCRNFGQAKVCHRLASPLAQVLASPVHLCYRNAAGPANALAELAAGFFQVISVHVLALNITSGVFPVAYCAMGLYSQKRQNRSVAQGILLEPVGSRLFIFESLFGKWNHGFGS